MEDYDLGTGIKVITIVFDSAKDYPEIHLDNVPITAAMMVFQQAAAALDRLIPYPKITVKGTTVMDPEMAFSFELDEEDDE